MSTELFRAIDNHDVDLVRDLLVKGLDPNAPSPEPPGWRPLGAAIEELEFGGDVQIVRLLLEHGADVNLPYINNDLAPLHAALCSDDVTVIRMLLEAGADPNAIDYEGQSPLQFAVDQDNPEMAKLLLQYGAAKTVNHSGGFCGDNALGMAVRKLNIAMAELLLRAGADPDALDSDDENARAHMPPRDTSNARSWDKMAEILTQSKTLQ